MNHEEELGLEEMYNELYFLREDLFKKLCGIEINQ